MAPTYWMRVRDGKVRSSIVIWEYKWCCPITLRAIWFVCIREVTLSFWGTLSKLEGPSCGHLLPSQTPLANQEGFLGINLWRAATGPSQHQLQQAVVSALHLCQQHSHRKMRLPKLEHSLRDTLALPSLPSTLSSTWISIKGIMCVF